MAGRIRLIADLPVPHTGAVNPLIKMFEGQLIELSEPHKAAHGDQARHQNQFVLGKSTLHGAETVPEFHVELTSALLSSHRRNDF